MNTIRKDGTEAPIGFSLVPIYPRHGGIATAAIMSCIATGRMISSMGGPGFALCPEVVEALDAMRHNGNVRAVVDAADWDNLRGCLAKLAEQVEEAGIASDDIGLTLEAAEQLLERTAP